MQKVPYHSLKPGCIASVIRNDRAERDRNKSHWQSSYNYGTRNALSVTASPGPMWWGAAHIPIPESTPLEANPGGFSARTTLEPAGAGDSRQAEVQSGEDGVGAEIIGAAAARFAVIIEAVLQTARKVFTESPGQPRLDAVFLIANVHRHRTGRCEERGIVLTPGPEPRKTQSGSDGDQN